MASPATADDYQRHYGSEVSEHLQAVNGFRGARLLRRDDGEEVMFTSITWFTSLDPIRGFTERGRGPAGQRGTLVPAGAAPAGPVERGGEGLFRGGLEAGGDSAGRHAVLHPRRTDKHRNRPLHALSR